MCQPSIFDDFWHLVEFQCLLENLAAAVKLTPHYGMLCMDLVQRSTSVLYAGAKEIGRQLIFHVFDARSTRIAKEKPDHVIIEDSVDKSVDDRA